MECRITITLIRESLTGGDIGDDWKYTLRADVTNPGFAGSGGAIDVLEHRLPPNRSQTPPPTRGLTLLAGECGTRPQVALKLDVAEVDFLVDDKASLSTTVDVVCPGPSRPPNTIERDLSVLVNERPGFLGGSTTFGLRIRLVAACV